MSARRDLPPPPVPKRPRRPGRTAALLDFLIRGLFGRPWMALWFRLHPRARTPLSWTYHEEIAAAPPGERWRRGLGFFVALPGAAAAQAEAESGEATRTGGEAPAPADPGGARFGDRLVLARRIVFLTVAALVAFAAAGAWFRAFYEIGEILDRPQPVAAGEVAALGLMLVLATIPVTIPVIGVLQRRRLAWRRPIHQAEPALETACWGVVLAVFCAIAFIGWFATLHEMFDRFDAGSLHGFNQFAGFAIIFLIVTAPLGALLWKRHRLSAAERRA